MIVLPWLVPLCNFTSVKAPTTIERRATPGNRQRGARHERDLQLTRGVDHPLRVGPAVRAQVLVAEHRRRGATGGHRRPDDHRRFLEQAAARVEVLVGGVNMVVGETISMMAHTTADTVVDQRKRTLLNNFWSLPLEESSRTIDREFQS